MFDLSVNERETVCSVERNGQRIGLTLREGTPGAGDWRVVGVSVDVTDLDAEQLTSNALRDLPLPTLVAEARQAIATTVRVASPFARVRDPLTPFLTSRRGRAARTDRDFAELAFEYDSERGSSSWREIPRLWAARHPQVSSARWSNYLNEATRRGYLTPGGPQREATDKTPLELYGVTWAELARLDEADDTLADASTVTSEDERAVDQAIREASLSGLRLPERDTLIARRVAGRVRAIQTGTARRRRPGGRT